MPGSGNIFEVSVSQAYRDSKVLKDCSVIGLLRRLDTVMSYESPAQKQNQPPALSIEHMVALKRAVKLFAANSLFTWRWCTW